MDRRTLLALFLTAIVIVFTPILLRRIGVGRQLPASAPGDTPASAPGDTSARVANSAASTPTPAAEAPIPAAVAATTTPARRRGDTTSVDFAKTQYTFSLSGAAPQSVSLSAYRNLGASSKMQPKATLQGGKPGTAPPLLRYRLVRGADTVALDTVAFTAERSDDAITFRSGGQSPITVRYQLTNDGYLTHVSGQVGGGATSGPTQLLVDLPATLRSQETDSIDDERHLAYAYKLEHDDVKSVAFTKLAKLDPAFSQTDSGPMTWVAARNKYFLVALVAPSSPASFLALRMRGGPLTPDKLAPTASATAVQSVRDGRFGFDLYAGPQSWSQLRIVGHELENANPYGGWLPGVQPFAAICLRVLLWIRQTLNVSYGWVLIIFGIAVRVLLWPLNQSAMRSSLKMQRLQPELTEVQKKYKNEPEKQREALVKLYQQHGMSPFSPIMGCLPALLPMPVLFALFFVFQNTIEFRGVSFLWLPDISQHDPYYIMPVIMGLTMLLLSWIGMRAAPPNPQTKMMSYMMPAMMTAVLWRFASGLNLYYAVQNIAALPQQLLLTRERMKAAPAAAPTPPLRSRRATT